MAQQKQKTKGRKKLCRSARKKSYYEAFRRKYTIKVLRCRVKREKAIAAAKGKAKKLHPSDLRRAQRRLHLQWSQRGES